MELFLSSKTRMSLCSFLFFTGLLSFSPRYGVAYHILLAYFFLFIIAFLFVHIRSYILSGLGMVLR